MSRRRARAVGPAEREGEARLGSLHTLRGDVEQARRALEETRDALWDVIGTPIGLVLREDIRAHVTRAPEHGPLPEPRHDCSRWRQVTYEKHYRLRRTRGSQPRGP